MGKVLTVALESPAKAAKNERHLGNDQCRNQRGHIRDFRHQAAQCQKERRPTFHPKRLKAQKDERASRQPYGADPYNNWDAHHAAR